VQHFPAVYQRVLGLERVGQPVELGESGNSAFWMG
jgi:hypothetical protein